MPCIGVLHTQQYPLQKSRISLFPHKKSYPLIWTEGYLEVLSDSLSNMKMQLLIRQSNNCHLVHRVWSWTSWKTMSCMMTFLMTRKTGGRKRKGRNGGSGGSQGLTRVLWYWATSDLCCVVAQLEFYFKLCWRSLFQDLNSCRPLLGQLTITPLSLNTFQSYAMCRLSVITWMQALMRGRRACEVLLLPCSETGDVFWTHRRSWHLDPALMSVAALWRAIGFSRPIWLCIVWIGWEVGLLFCSGHWNLCQSLAITWPP